MSIIVDMIAKSAMKCNSGELSCVYIIKVFLVKVLQRKLGQSFLGQVRLFTLSKLFEGLVQAITENALKSSKYVNISH